MLTEPTTVQTVASVTCARRRYATEGPLSTLIPVFVDVETYMNERRGISLSSMTLRQYIKNSYLTSIAVAIADSATEVWLTPNGEAPKDLIALLTELAKDPRYVFVCHNAAFDIRVLRFMLGIPQPKNVWCTVEGAMGAWPECVGGYSLKALGAFLQLPVHMLKIDVEEAFGKTLEQLTGAEMAQYNTRDVDSMREIYYYQIACLSAREQEIALMTHHVRQFNFVVDPDALVKLIEKLDLNANDAQENASELLSMEQLAEVFNRNTGDGSLRSVRVQRLSKLITEKWNVTLPTTSLKKLSPILQAKYPEVTNLLKQTSRANKMISHGRRSKIFRGVPEVDVELGFARAHTFRFSSPSSGKGLNLHNVPKHDKSVAEPIRRVFRMPPDKCLVRGDLANVEFRVEGWLTDSKNVFKMFDPALGGDINNDPYCMTWKAMTSIAITKKDPVRQVAKSAVLGLGYCMGAAGYANVLLGVLADKKSKVTEEKLNEMRLSLGWEKSKRLNYIMEKTNCTEITALAAYHIHRLFNEAYPEYTRVADWLLRLVENVSACGDSAANAQYEIDRMYQSHYAPDRNKIGIELDPDETTGVSLRVRCGPWTPTVCWRQPLVRSIFTNNHSEPRLTILKATGEEKPFTKQLAIENVTQSAARNALCYGLLELKKRGVVDILHIHDEVMIITDRKREAVLQARQHLIDVFGPGNNHPMNWAILIKPEEITVTESMYEDEMDVAVPKLNKETGKMSEGNDRWGKILRNEPDMFLNLT